MEEVPQMNWELYEVLSTEGDLVGFFRINPSTPEIRKKVVTRARRLVLFYTFLEISIFLQVVSRPV